MFPDTTAPWMVAVSTEVTAMVEPVPNDHSNAVEPLQAGFLALVPRIENIVAARLRHIPCPDRRRDLLCEATALCWAWYLGLARKGRNPVDFLFGFGLLAARAVLSGRRLCGCEKAKDVLSPVCRSRRGFTVSPLPEGTPLSGGIFEDALTDNTQTPVPDQVQFRIDFPRWRASQGERCRELIDALAAGHRTTELAEMFGISQARISRSARRRPGRMRRPSASPNLGSERGSPEWREHAPWRRLRMSRPEGRLRSCRATASNA